MIISALAGHIPMGAIVWAVYLKELPDVPGELVLTAIYGLFVYEALAYSYFHLFNMSETARRIRILLEIYASGKLTASGIASAYGASDMLDTRIERLLSTRQVRWQGGRLFLDGRLLYHAARVIVWWGRVLGFPPPGDVFTGSGTRPD